MKNNFLFLVFIALISGSSFGQSQEDIKKITANYDLPKLKEKEDFYRKKSKVDKQKAIAIAIQNNWPIRVEKPDGSISELMRISQEGFPIYYNTDNTAAARSTRTNHINTGGSLGLNLDGQGMTVRVWDGGNVRATHNAFGGRVEVIDGVDVSTIQHATHVTGTMIAGSNPSLIKGMASMANARTFDWFEDAAEALSEVQLGMLISNHSYGTPVSSVPSSIIGAYNSGAQLWDDIAYNSPYYLAVMSAGNDGNNNSNTEPIAFGFDKLVYDKVAKNTLVVANALDVTTNSDGSLTVPFLINSGSSQGPTDDLRIKPDITGNGTQLTSTSNGTNSATATLTGTSMASPNVSGSLILLQQHFKNLTNNFMRAATLKGLACHTANDGGEIGPDATYGWGLLNAKKAVETISNNGLNSWISEETLNTNQIFSMNVNSNGTTPLIASITWTDLPGNLPPNSGIVNDQTPALINDLDIRITKNSTIYYPWKLTSDPYSPAIRTTDNNRDNVEQVAIDAPTSGQYNITINHKGNLVTGKQKFSLVITGINSAFALTSTSDDLTICSNQNAFYNFNYTQTGAGTTTFSVVDLPPGAIASFSPTSLSSNGTVTMTISGLSNVVPNEYFIGIRGTNTTETETRYKSLRVYNSSFFPVTLLSPSNGQLGLSTSTLLTWANNPNAINYTLQVSTFNNFSSLLTNQLVTTNSFNLENLSQATRYYWRVIPQNNCGASVPIDANVYSFVTGTLVCNINFAATDYSNNFIDVVANSEASVPLVITGGYTIGDLNVNVGITHTWIGDIIITLEGPASIGTPIINLLENPCGDFQNINCTMDDNGLQPACSGNPAITGLIAPLSPLSVLNTLPADGVWILRVLDPNNLDGGTIDSFSINLCRVEQALSVVTNPILSSTVYPNPTKGIVNVAIPSLTETATIKLFDLQGRQILSRETNQVYTSFGIENLQDGIYLVNIGNDQGSITKKIILKRN